MGKFKGAIRSAISASEEAVQGLIKHVGGLASPVDDWLKSNDLESSDADIAYSTAAVGSVVVATLCFDRLIRLAWRRR